MQEEGQFRVFDGVRRAQRTFQRLGGVFGVFILQPDSGPQDEIMRGQGGSLVDEWGQCG